MLVCSSWYHRSLLWLHHHLTSVLRKEGSVAVGMWRPVCHCCKAAGRHNLRELVGSGWGPGTAESLLLLLGAHVFVLACCTTLSQIKFCKMDYFTRFGKLLCVNFDTCTVCIYCQAGSSTVVHEWFTKFVVLGFNGLAENACLRQFLLVCNSFSTNC